MLHGELKEVNRPNGKLPGLCSFQAGEQIGDGSESLCPGQGLSELSLDEGSEGCVGSPSR